VYVDSEDVVVVVVKNLLHVRVWHAVVERTTTRKQPGTLRHTTYDMISLTCGKKN